MEIVVLIIMLLVSFSFVLKLTFHGLPGRVAVCAVAALFLLLACDRATMQSKTQIADWLADTGLMLDVSVWLTVDVALQLCFCVMASSTIATVRGKVAMAVVKWVPGLLIFPVLFAMLVGLLFELPGVDFATIARSSAAAVLVGGPLLAGGFRLLLPERDIRLELMFMVNLLIAALGVVATVNGRTAAVGTNTVEWGALAGVLAILAAGAVTGFIVYKYKTSKIK